MLAKKRWKRYGFIGIIAALLLAVTPLMIMAGGQREPGPGGADDIFCGLNRCQYVPPPYIGNIGMKLEIDFPFADLVINGTVEQFGTGYSITFNNYYFSVVDLTEGEPLCADLKPNDLSGYVANIGFEEEDVECKDGDGQPWNCFGTDNVINIEIVGVGNLVCSDNISGSAQMIMMEYVPVY